MAIAKKRCSEYNKSLANDLHDMARLAERYALFNEWSDLDSAASALDSNTSARWRYSLSALTFNLPLTAVKWPTPIESVVCRASLDIGGRLILDSRNAVASQTDGWQVNLRLEAVDSHKEVWLQFWHFDQHPGGNTPPEIHPLYHASFGGAHLETWRVGKENNTCVGLVEMEAPRLQTPPLDAVLLIDFVLSHFNGEKWAKTRGDPGYITLVANAQKRAWSSYVENLSAFFKATQTAQETHPARALWPNLAVTPKRV